jgi:hypothetical protein
LREQISEKCTEKLVEEFNYIHCNDSGLSFSLSVMIHDWILLNYG